MQTFALPLGHGTMLSLLPEQHGLCKVGVASNLVNKESGRRGSDSRPPPWQGGALPTELLPHKSAAGRNRTTDTQIFSLLLYRLSYRGKYRDLGIIPESRLDSEGKTYVWFDATEGEYMPFRGSAFNSTSFSGPSALSLDLVRSYSYVIVGFRSAFYEVNGKLITE